MLGVKMVKIWEAEALGPGEGMYGRRKEEGRRIWSCRCINRAPSGANEHPIGRERRLPLHLGQ